MENILDEKSKKNVLAGLKNEVSDFHPFLNNLFKKLPRIKKVEHTHGTDEKGADFVLLRHDDTLGTDEFIGVIVKVGKIVQDISKIREQIEECNLERYFDNGKKKIRVDEIWVITNENITEGAKIKIYDSFASRKIRFLQHTDLIKLIDKHYPNFWYDIPLDISEYLTSINKHIKNLESAFSLISNNHSDFYIEQDLEEMDFEYKYSTKKDKSRKQKKIKLEKIIDVIVSNKVVFIEGRPGFGKSKLQRYAVSYFSSPINYLKYKLIPIFITYKELADNYEEDPLKFIEYSTSLLEKHKSDCGFVLFIDGFDEKLYSAEEEYERLSMLESKLKKIDNCKSVITSRPLNYVDPKNLRSLNIKWYELLPLTLPKILTFFDVLCKKSLISSRIIEDIKKSHLFKQLPKSPIAAILLANLINENSKDLPSNLTELYSKYCELMLGRWDISKGLQSEKEYESAKTIIMNLANFFIENDLEYLALDEAKGFFHKYLSERNLGINPDELFNKITCRSGIVQREEYNNRVYFKHRTFAEYFYASYIGKHPKEEFLDEKVYSYYWRNICFFYIGLQKDCEEQLNKIINQKPKSVVQRFLRIPNLADYFLAGYATPYRVISENLSTILKEASILYLDIINKRVETNLQQLPLIGILYLFQSIIRNSYSYDFFVPAIESAVLDVLSDESIDKEIKMHTMFFISVILIELKKDNPFDGLLGNFKDELPFPLQFAITYENDNLKGHSTILKKQEKRLKRIMEHSSKELRNYIDNIHTKPVSTITKSP